MNFPNLSERLFNLLGSSDGGRTRARVVTSRAEEYRRLAQECLEVARTVKNQESRAILIRMAQIWQRLAAEQEAALAQQQQQVQPKDDDEKETP